MAKVLFTNYGYFCYSMLRISKPFGVIYNIIPNMQIIALLVSNIYFFVLGLKMK
jgi:hypothetical protein